MTELLELVSSDSTLLSSKKENDYCDEELCLVLISCDQCSHFNCFTFNISADIFFGLTWGHVLVDPQFHGLKQKTFCRPAVKK